MAEENIVPAAPAPQDPNAPQTPAPIVRTELALGDSERSIVTEMETCYLDYAMSVICQRALPDVRDGLKPVHRRILYSMHEKGLRSSAKYKKSATIVGDVLGKYHPHGDTAVYDSMVRMAQDFSLRYPLIDGQGNFGSIDGDGAAAYRYTEARMSKVSDFLLADIDKDTVDWRDNYDASCQEPTVMPTRLPNLLLNGSAGIAVGMATNIPPHNLVEVIDAILFLLRHKKPEEVVIEDLLQFIKGPDFPTGGIIYNRKDILNAYATGRGSIVVRGRAEIVEIGSKQAIIISEIPYMVNKSTMIERIADLVREKIVTGISDLRDESTETIRIVIELKRDAFPKKVLNQLFQLTDLQSSFPFNMIALHDRGIQPKLFNLLEILVEFVAHRREVVKRRTAYELRMAEERLHILEGFKIALDNIDEVVNTIKKSKSRDDASVNLQKKFKLSEKQAAAILEMQLQRLSGLERQKIEDELKEKRALVADLKDILAKPARIDKIVGTELEEIKEKHGDERRTKVMVGALGEFNPKDTIPNEDVVIALSATGYVKRIKSDAFRTQRRGGRGVTTATKEEDEIRLVLSTQNHNDILYFTNKGRVFALPAYELSEMARTAKGQPIVNFLQLQKDEEVSALLDITAETGKHLFLATRLGTVKRLDMEDLRNIRSSGLIAMKVDEGDNLGWVRTTSGNDKITMVSRGGQAIQFAETDARVMGRAAMGVRGIRLREKDEVVTVDVVRATDLYLLTVTETGMGKISEISEYREQNRGGSGVKAMSVTPKTGQVIGAAMLTEADRKESDVMLISKEGQTIRFPLKTVRETGRVAQGVILTKLSDKKDKVVSFSVVKAGEGEDAPEEDKKK